MARAKAVSEVDVEDQLDLSRYVPFYVRAIANKLASAASRVYKQNFGIGLNEWSCLAALAAEGETSASRICAVSGYDKALVSRSLSSLEEKGLVEARPGQERARRRLIHLTVEGQRMYLAIRELAMMREQRLLDGLSEHDRATLMGYLETMQRNASALVEEAAVGEQQEEM